MARIYGTCTFRHIGWQKYVALTKSFDTVWDIMELVWKTHHNLGNHDSERAP